MNKHFSLFLVLVMLSLLCSCGSGKLSTEEEMTIAGEVSEQCNHIVSLAMDNSVDGIEFSHDIEENKWVSNFTIISMKGFDWHGYGDVVLDMEESINSLALSIKQVFDESELKDENYSVIINLVDSDNTVYFTSTNGLTTYSAWGN